MHNKAWLDIHIDCVRNGRFHSRRLQSKPKSVAVKRETVKDEPLSPKSEPEALPQQDKKPRAKKGEGEKKVVIKKEYGKPGQTRDTPLEVGQLPEAMHALRLQLLCIAMIRFCAYLCHDQVLCIMSVTVLVVGEDALRQNLTLLCSITSIALELQRTRFVDTS